MSSDLQFAIQNPKSTTAQRSFVPRGFRRVLFLSMVVAAIALSFAGARWPAAKAAPETPESHRLRFVELFAASIAVIPMAPTAMTFVVNTTNDTLLAGACAAATPGQCSLREAIVEANANPGADTIDATSVTGTINLTAALPNITEDVTINGPGASLLTVRRNTGGVYRIFTVTTAGTVTFFGLTISNGNASTYPNPGGNAYAFEGGGIDNISGGTVNVTNCVLSNNSASIAPDIGTGGGINNGVGCTLNVTNTILSGNFVDGPGSNGGAITNAGTLNITDSTLIGNYIKSKWTWGGGIASFGTAKITNSTISANSAETGGGISSSGTLNVINSTIAGNTAVVGGGIAAGDCTLNVTNSTISGNSATESGGITVVFKSSLTLKSTIVALNTAQSFPDLHGLIISQGYNIVGTTSGATIVATTGDQFGVTATQLKLGPLGNKGGPTQTMALGYGSVAIDQGINSSSLATDQRGVGFARTYDDPAVTNATGGNGTDVGAFEAQPGEAKPGISNICDTHPWICHGLCEIPCPRCFGGCIYEIVFEDLVDPWKAALFDPRGNLVTVQQTKRGNQVTMRFRVNERFADKVGEYTVVFRGGKPGTKPAATFQVKAIQ